MHPLDEATTLVACGPGQWRGRATDTYWNMVGPHGGVIASILLRGVLAHQARMGDPCAITVNFTAAIARGDFEVSARVVRTGKSVQHRYVELSQNEVVAANATVVCSARRTTWRSAGDPWLKAPS